MYSTTFHVLHQKLPLVSGRSPGRFFGRSCQSSAMGAHSSSDITESAQMLRYGAPSRFSMTECTTVLSSS